MAMALVIKISYGTTHSGKANCSLASLVLVVQQLEKLPFVPSTGDMLCCSSSCKLSLGMPVGSVECVHHCLLNEHAVCLHMQGAWQCLQAAA